MISLDSQRVIVASGSELWCWNQLSSSSSSSSSPVILSHTPQEEQKEPNVEESTNTNVPPLLPSNHDNHDDNDSHDDGDEEVNLIHNLHSVIWDIKQNCDGSKLMAGSADGLLRYDFSSFR